MALELFSANRATTTVTSGGTDAPSPGTQETWTVASSAMFGTASTGVSQFHVADPAAPTEIIAVTNVSGTTWTVTRGAESTTPVVHASGFTVYQVVTTGVLGSFQQSGAVTATALADLSGSVNVSGATAPTATQVLTATSGTTATWQTPQSGFSNPMTTLGDLIAENTVPTAARVAGNTTATKNFLSQTGTGSASALPVWGTIASGDLPAATTSVQGAVIVSGSASTIQPSPGTAASAGGSVTTDVAYADHVHGMPGLFDPWGLGANLNYLPPAPQVASQAMSGASLVIWTRFYTYGYTMSTVYVDVGNQSGSVATAIYAPSVTNPALPGNQVATSGGTACPSIGVQALTLGTAVAPGRGYWIAFVADNTVATFRQLPGLTVPGASTWILASTVTGVALPSTGTAATSGAGDRYPLLSSVSP